MELHGVEHGLAVDLDEVAACGGADVVALLLRVKGDHGVVLARDLHVAGDVDVADLAADVVIARVDAVIQAAHGPLDADEPADDGLELVRAVEIAADDGIAEGIALRPAIDGHGAGERAARRLGGRKVSGARRRAAGRVPRCAGVARALRTGRVQRRIVIVTERALNHLDLHVASSSWQFVGTCALPEGSTRVGLLVLPLYHGRARDRPIRFRSRSSAPAQILTSPARAAYTSGRKEKGCAGDCKKNRRDAQ